MLTTPPLISADKRIEKLENAEHPSAIKLAKGVSELYEPFKKLNISMKEQASNERCESFTSREEITQLMFQQMRRRLKTKHHLVL